MTRSYKHAIIQAGLVTRTLHRRLARTAQDLPEAEVGLLGPLHQARETAAVLTERDLQLRRSVRVADRTAVIADARSFVAEARELVRLLDRIPQANPSPGVEWRLKGIATLAGELAEAVEQVLYHIDGRSVDFMARTSERS